MLGSEESGGECTVLSSGVRSDFLFLRTAAHERERERDGKLRWGRFVKTRAKSKGSLCGRGAKARILLMLSLG